MVPVADPRDINAGGQIVGGGGLWTPTTPNAATGTYTDLGPNFGGVAFNRSGQVVGYQGYGNEYEGYAVPALWSGGVVADLNALVPAGSWLSAPAGINDAGLIVGTVDYLNGRYDVPLLLTPTALPSVAVGDATADEGAGVAAFTVSLSNAYTLPVTVRYATADGSAAAGGDYLATGGLLTFAPGETTKTITIEVKGDSKREANEYFYLDLDAVTGNSVFAKKRGVGTILNDD